MDQIKGYLESLSGDDQKIHREAFLHLVKEMAASSSSVTARCRDGRNFDAIFHTATPFTGRDFRICLKAIQVLSEEGNSVEDPNVASGSTLILSSEEWSSIHAKKLRLKLDSSELLTDGSIRGRDLSHLIDRELTEVAGNWLDPTTHSTLESGKGGATGWDQFAANRKLSDYKGSSFDENLYTSKLNKGRLTEAQKKHAERLANEIEGQSSDNIHLRQERGHALEEGDGDGDEEALWSGVLGSGRFQKGSAVTKTDKDVNLWKRGGKVGGADVPANPSKQRPASPAAVAKKEEKPQGTWAARAGAANKKEKADGSPSKSVSTTAPTSEPKPEPEPEPKPEKSRVSAPIPASAIDSVELADDDKDRNGDKKSALKPTAKSFVFKPSALAKEYTPSVTAVTKAITGNVGAPSPDPVPAPVPPALPSPQMPSGFPQVPVQMMPQQYDPNYPQMMSMPPMVPVDQFGNPVHMQMMPDGMMQPIMMMPGFEMGYSGYPPQYGYQGQGSGNPGQGYPGRSRGGRGGYRDHGGRRDYLKNASGAVNSESTEKSASPPKEQENDK